MAIDMEKMRSKLSKLRGESNGNGGSVLWKPQEGNQDIRIVPTEDGDPLKEMWFHYNLGDNRGFLCPKRNFGDRCPVCDFASNLWREGVENNDNESKKLAKSLFVRQRFDITDTESGTDITLTYTKPSKPGAFPQTTLKPRRHTSPLLDDAERTSVILDNIPDVNDLFERTTPEQVETMLDGFLSDDDSAEEESRENFHVPGTETSSVDAAFEELLG